MTMVDETLKIVWRYFDKNSKPTVNLKRLMMCENKILFVCFVRGAFKKLRYKEESVLKSGNNKKERGVN